MSEIHPQSIIEDGAKLGDNITIGPFCHIGANVELGDSAILESHVSLQGSTRIGSGCHIYPFASVGNAPQDLKYAGEKSELVIGKNCLIREGVTINTGTEGGGNLTRIGDNCTFLAYTHIAHDCIVGSNVILSNASMIAGHCVIGDNVIFGGGAGVHQYCRIGSYAFVGGLAAVDSDIIPFGTAVGNRAYLSGLNLVGMKRANIARASIHSVRNIFKQLFDGAVPVQTKATELRLDEQDKYAIEILDFILNASDRPLCLPVEND